MFIWPPAPTVIKPSRLATITTAISTALLQLRDAKRVWVSCPVQSLCPSPVSTMACGGGLSEDAPNTQQPRHSRDAAGDVNVAAAAPHIVGFDAGGDGGRWSVAWASIGVVSLVDEHPDRPVDRRRIA